jgi:hypothetical protein
MIRSLALVLTSVSALAFAAPAMDKDGVPGVDQQMPLREFLATYCQGKYQNATCVRGSKINSIDGSSGPQATLPKGL